MDVAYDHIQEEILTSQGDADNNNNNNASTNQRQNLDLNAEFQETFRAFSASPWGTRLGGFWNNVRKQGESYYEGARQEYAAASEEAVKGFTDLRESLVGRTRGLSLSTAFTAGNSPEGDETEGDKDGAVTPTSKEAPDGQQQQQQQQQEEEEPRQSGEGFISRFKTEAARRLKEIEKAEEAADEAILRFGMNVVQKMREAVSIVPPGDEESSKLLFESKDAEGKRVIHATRFEAQLHVIHSNPESFSKDPVSDQWAKFREDFNIDSKTSAIAADLETYPELREAMEKLVPETVEYADFWTRYYFLRLVIETEEKKRKELLKGANVDEEEEVGWDDDTDSESDSGSDSPSTPQVKSSKSLAPAAAVSEKDTLKPGEPRRSNDQQSQPDSESSYDLVSGTASRAPESPKEKTAATDAKADESDEDWE
ncbi:hypothetical protein ASPZODRAFT_90101 [Penicilliopsis zonata CBS 506.65]|uniref:BSD domain-containing protein n=1 Tax=Penicilliopsis zonata CBS 506.65 TaxID=1073090 RepID=A0A1L9SSV2_9EURO|nr:hypothetical protein ASPZODRAFT_90101 [Penicilliopsis zonata CBS 506.65]OJJ50187.1 hypothetical protein ASPZODRAFT_90101 [Penicilliopsis zonata CBS 506.65]